MAMRIHRVTPAYIREVATAGYTNVPVQKLTAMRINGIDGALIRSTQKKPGRQ